MKKIISFVLIVVMLMSFAGCSITEEDLSEAGDKIGDYLIQQAKDKWCDHTVAYKYDKNTNEVTCKCGTESIADLSYTDFVNVLSVWQKKSLVNTDSWWQDEKLYHAEMYLTYRGIDANYINLVCNLPEKLVESEDAPNKLALIEECFTILGKMTPFVDTYAKHLEGKVELWTAYYEIYKMKENKVDYDINAGVKLNCAETVSKSVKIANSAITAYNFLTTTDDPGEACMKFIEEVEDIIGYAPAHFEVYYTVMLDALKFSLESFFQAYADYTFTMDTYEAAIANGDGCFTRTTGWSQFQNCNNWEKYLEGVNGTEGTDFLPSLEEAVTAYNESSELGQQLLSKYIVFRMNKIFKENLGITYEEYVRSLEG